MVTLAEKELIKAEILEELKSERYGMTAWRRFGKDVTRPKLLEIVGDLHAARKLEASLNQFVVKALGKTNRSPIKEQDMDKAKKAAEIFIRAFLEASKL
ncbi:MAG: hypothetical protein APF81_27425 [Desulfosporosinus sp. BRH_c37]|nr:MAG: hypothetical protein APF81_27425 [Desulfosporosinus sp. BRH_c37]